MDKIQKFEISDEFLMESAEKRFESGDYLGALSVLNRRAESFDPSADASALYADIYEALGLYPLCADAWFRFLDTCNEADFAEGYEGLSSAFLNMGDEFQSRIYLERTFEEDGIPVSELFETERPNLRLVHSDDGSIEHEELLREGIESIRAGELGRAKEAFSEIPPESKDFPSATGLSAMCRLLEGDAEGAAKDCEKLLEYYPENVHALTTYCAVLGAKGDKEGAKEVGRRLSKIETDSMEDLFRISTALCETELDEEAYQKLKLLKEKAPYGDDVLWFYAVASYRTGKIDEAISALETMTLLNCRKAVAKYYLVSLRKERDEGGEKLPLSYFYKVPEREYEFLKEFFSAASSASIEESAEMGNLKEFPEYVRIAFDQLDGRDEKLQVLAAKAAVNCRVDKALREILLDFNASEGVKLLILRELCERNEENSFGVVVCGFYREFFTHELEIGKKNSELFLKAFSEVYSKYALVGEENEEKLIGAAEEVYDALEEADVLDLAEEQKELAAVIYREARVKHSERSIERICELFEANVNTVKEILNYIL